MLGTLLGEIRAGQQRMLMLLEAIHAQMQINGRLLAERLPRRRRVWLGDGSMTTRDWLQIGLAIGVVTAALLGRLPLKEVIEIATKPLG